jgi:hypothetical protein
MKDLEFTEHLNECLKNQIEKKAMEIVLSIDIAKTINNIIRDIVEKEVTKDLVQQAIREYSQEELLTIAGKEIARQVADKLCEY